MKTETIVRYYSLYLCGVKRRSAKIMLLWAEPILFHLVTIKNATLESEHASSNISFIQNLPEKRCEIFVYRHFLSSCFRLLKNISTLPCHNLSISSLPAFLRAGFFPIHFRIRIIQSVLNAVLSNSTFFSYFCTQNRAPLFLPNTNSNASGW